MKLLALFLKLLVLNCASWVLASVKIENLQPYSELAKAIDPVFGLFVKSCSGILTLVSAYILWENRKKANK